MCAKCGGATKTKMAKGGSMKTTVGSKSAKPFIAGIPNGGPTGPNYQGVDTMKKGGAIKKKYQMGGSKIGDKIRGAADKIRGAVKKAPAPVPAPVPVDAMYTNTTPGQIAMPPMKKGGAMRKKYANGGYTNTTAGQMPDYSKMKKGGATKKYAKGGSSFGMLSVKAGVDKNPKATAADRIAGAKMNKKKMGGTTKKK